MDGVPRLLAYYKQTARAKLQKEFGLTNPHEVPRLAKVVLNVGMGDAGKNPEAARGGSRGAGDDHGAEGGDHPRQEGDRQFRPPGRHAGGVPR